MKKIILSFLLGMALLITNKCFATSYTAPYASAQTGGVIYASQWNANQTSLESFLNNQNLDGTTNIAIGGIQTSNIANSAVTDAKIAGITTAGKVNGSAIIGLGNLAAGAGTIPPANLGSGSASASTVLYGNSTYASAFPGPILAVHNTATQSIGSGVTAQRTFGSVDEDSGGYFASNTYTPLVAGWYYVTYMDSIVANGSATSFSLMIYKNGSSYATTSTFGTAVDEGDPIGLVASTIVFLNGSTDYIQFYIGIGSGGGTAQGSGYSYASIARVF
jgi:hypothetical protein